MKPRIYKSLHIINLETCNSTNDYLKNNKPKLQDKFPLMVTSKEQLKGRGREESKWISLRNKGIYSSFGVFLNQKNLLSLIPIISGISVIETLKKFSPKNFYLKWPNDILHEGKKISGILIENIIQGQKIINITGIGININHLKEDFPDQIKKQATSLKIITGKNYEISKVNKFLAKYFLYWLNQLENGQQQKIISKANQMSQCLIGKKIQLHQKNKKIKGVFMKINNAGGIIIKNKNGTQNTYFYGEINSI